MTTAYIGIDLHRTVIQICVLDARGSPMVSNLRHLSRTTPSEPRSSTTRMDRTEPRNATITRGETQREEI